MMTALILLALTLHTDFSVSVSRPSNRLRECQASTSLSALEVLPGGGWDNLRNMDMGRVMDFSYSQCQTTEDRLYLIPDEVFVIPQKETGVETSSEIISSWLDRKSLTSSSINTEMSFMSSINGKFSAEYQKVKTQSGASTSMFVISRMQVRNVIYTVKAYPDFTLDSRFVQQVKGIADAIENGLMKNAAYLSEKMVLDYGTHVVTDVDAGATLVEEDYLSSKYVSDHESDGFIVNAQAGLFFFNELNFEINTQSENQKTQNLRSNIQNSIIHSYGGVPFFPGLTLQKWQESTRNNIVAIDRSGFPLHYIINSQTLPNIAKNTVVMVAKAVEKAIHSYYNINTRPGCVDVNSPNFNFQANVDDASCEGPATNLSFGGIYQQCSYWQTGSLCDKVEQKNPETGDFSCGYPYTATLLRSEWRGEEMYPVNECYDNYYSCGIFGMYTCTDQVCQDNYYSHFINLNTYWCSVNGEAPANSGYLFGGIYGPSVLNPITNSESCPLNFIPVKFLSDDLMICISKDYETASQFAVPFGGFFSCETGNPLANGQRRCPPKFSQHLATVSDGCEILYCVQSGLFTGGELKPIILPPFTKPSAVGIEMDNTVMTEGDKSWAKIGKNKPRKADPEGIQETIKKTIPKSRQTVSSELKTGVVGVIFGVLAMVALVIVVGVVLVKKNKKSNNSETIK